MNTTRIYIILLVFLMSIFLLSITVISDGLREGDEGDYTINADGVQGTTQAHHCRYLFIAYEPMFDTWLTSGANTWHNGTSGLYLQGNFFGADKVAVIKWDTTPIPDTADTSNFNITWGFYTVDDVDNPTCQLVCKNVLKNISLDPQNTTTTNSNNLFEEAWQGPRWARTNDITVDGWHYLTSSNNNANPGDVSEVGSLTYNLVNDIDWWAIGLSSRETSISGCNCEAEIAGYESAYDSMQTWVHFDACAPIITDISPNHNAVLTSNNPTISVDYEHILSKPVVANQSSTIYFDYFDDINNDPGEWYNFASVIAETNETISTTFTNDTIPDREYIWRARALDGLGNWTNTTTFSFFSPGVDAPEDIECERNGPTGINVLFVKMLNGSGTAYTEGWYKAGGVPTEAEIATWGTTTNYMGNVTSQEFHLTGLDFDECYGFALRTNYDSGVSWGYSGFSYKYPCCTSTLSYNISFRYENETIDTAENNLINFDNFPCSTHRLELRYSDKSEYYYINATNDANPLWINTSSDLLYFEFWWNYTIMENKSDCACNFTSSYTRMLLPCSSEGLQNNITFYMIVDRHIYYDYYIPDINCTSYVWYIMNDNLVRYEFIFDDRTGGVFANQQAFDTYSTIYLYNSTETLHVIHQEYWDSARVINPVLMYAKGYFMGVNCSSWEGKFYENIGLVPNQAETDPYPIVINPHTNESLSFASKFIVDYNWSDVGTGLWFDFEDTTFLTTQINLTVTDVLNESHVYYTNVVNGSNNYFSVAGLNQSISYKLILTITYNGVTDSAEYHIYPDFVPSFNSNYIDNQLQTIFGQLPGNLDTGETMQYHLIIVFIIGLIPLALFGHYYVSIASMGVGIWIAGFGLMIDIVSLIPIGIFLILMGVLMVFAGRSKG